MPNGGDAAAHTQSSAYTTDGEIRGRSQRARNTPPALGSMCIDRSATPRPMSTLKARTTATETIVLPRMVSQNWLRKMRAKFSRPIHCQFERPVDVGGSVSLIVNVMTTGASEKTSTRGAAGHVKRSVEEVRGY